MLNLKEIKRKIVNYIDMKYMDIVINNRELAADKDEDTYRREINQFKSEIIYINDRIKRIQNNESDKEKELNKKKEVKKKKEINSDIQEALFFILKIISKLIIIPLIMFMIMDIPYRVNTFVDGGINALLALIFVITFDFIVISILINI